jgi:hypothetical protein
LFRTGLLTDLVAVEALVADLPIEPVHSPLVVEIFSPLRDTGYRLAGRLWADRDGVIHADRNLRWVLAYRVPDDLRAPIEQRAFIDADAGTGFLYALAEYWGWARPNPYSPVRLLVNGDPVALAAGRPPELLPRVAPRVPPPATPQPPQGRLFSLPPRGRRHRGRQVGLRARRRT